MRKFVSIVIVLTLTITSAGVTAVSIKETNIDLKWGIYDSNAATFFDELDQQQPDMDWFGPIGCFVLAPGVNYIIAQSFKPTKNVLTRVELMIGKNSTTIYDYRVAIRANLTGFDLTSISVPAANIPTENFSWVEFDFPDITVTPGETYYIVSSTVNATDNWYAWGMKTGDAYSYGTVYYTIDDEETWLEETGGDMTFRTYGIYNQPPEPPAINGKTKIRINILYEYTFVSTDPDADEIYYCIDWGDGTPEICVGPYVSGVEGKATHTWTTKGNFTIKAKAKDSYGAESDWTQLEITTPKMISISCLFQQFLKNHPYAFPIIRFLLKQ